MQPLPGARSLPSGAPTIPATAAAAPDSAADVGSQAFAALAEQDVRAADVFFHR